MVYSSNAMEAELELTDYQRVMRDYDVLEWLKETSISYWIHTPTTGVRPGPRHPLFHLTLDFD